jgi:hypothetical protein
VGENDLSEVVRERGSECVIAEFDKQEAEALTRAADAKNVEAEPAAEEGDQRSEEQAKRQDKKDSNDEAQGKSPARLNLKSRGVADNQGTITYPIVDVAKLDVYYDRQTGAYWIPDSVGRWTRVNESGAGRFLKSKGISAKLLDKLMSPMEVALLGINQSMHVAYAGPLAGYRAGIYAIQGERVLVTNSPNIIAPKPGEFSKINQLLVGMLGPEQLQYFLSWLKIAYGGGQGGAYLQRASSRIGWSN